MKKSCAGFKKDTEIATVVLDRTGHNKMIEEVIHKGTIKYYSRIQRPVSKRRYTILLRNTTITLTTEQGQHWLHTIAKHHTFMGNPKYIRRMCHWGLSLAPGIHQYTNKPSSSAAHWTVSKKGCHQHQNSAFFMEIIRTIKLKAWDQFIRSYVENLFINCTFTSCNRRL